MKKERIIKYLKGFYKRNKIYSIINIVFFVLFLILLILNFKLGIIFLIIDLILNLLFIETGGLEFIKDIMNKKEETENLIDETKEFSADSIYELKDDPYIIDSEKEEKEDMKKTKAKLKSKRKNNKKKNKIIRFIINTCLFLFLILLILAVVFCIYIVIKAPDFDPQNLYKTEASVLYDANGKQITKLGIEKRKNVTYEDLPEVLVDAIIATEDSRFMQHNGFDAPRFFKASVGQVINKLAHNGGNAGGGSTITMQVVKNDYTSTVSSGFDGIVRKFTDIYISVFKLEKKYSKEEIIEFYVNTPFLGNGAYGVEQACQSYFGKSVSDINLSEAAVIAGLFQAPTSYNPYRYPETTEQRRNTVLYLMKKHGYITEEQQKMAQSIPIESLLNHGSGDESNSSQYQSYIDVVIEEVEKKTGDNPYTAGMKIYTNLDPSKQDVLNKIYSGETWQWKDDKINAGIAIVDVNTGKLVAVGGGRNQTGERQYNFATMINRQIGSCAKPLFDYGPAYEYNNASEATQVLDAPHTYSNGTSIKNADGSYGGLMTYKYAMAASRNIPAVKVFQSVDNAKIKEFVTNLGIKPEVDSNGYLHEAHALGAFNGSNPKELAGAYAAFANGGYYTEPYTVSRVEYIDNEKTVSLKPKRKKAMSDSTAYMITDALLYAVNSYGNIGGGVDGVQLAAKTGTSNFDAETRRKYGFPASANNDMWVTGFTPEYAVSLWYGYASIEAGYYSGSEGYSARGQLFRQIISSISTPGKTFEVPSSVVKGTIEKETFPGLLPSANTPDDMKVTEYFKKGTVPSEVSNRYATLDNPGSLNASVGDDTVTLSWNAASGNNYYNQEALAVSLKGLYLKEANEKAAEIISSNGEFGYEVFVESPTTTTSLGFTKSTKFTTKRLVSDAKYIVKTCYSNNKSSSSSGISTQVAGTGEIESVAEDNVTFNDSSEIDLTLSGNEVSYTEKGFSINGVNITNSNAHVVVNTSASKTGTGIDSVYTFTAKGQYKIDYTITYEGETYTATRIINVK